VQINRDRARSGVSLITVHGPDILARYLTQPGPPDKYGNRWQYHSRSDRHSKVGCWGVALDLLATSSLLRRHVDAGKVILGVNHTMTDFATSRKKDLDLVIARPAGEVATGARTFAGLVAQYGIELTELELGVLGAIPSFPVGPVGAVLVALEAKGCRPANFKSLHACTTSSTLHICASMGRRGRRWPSDTYRSTTANTSSHLS